MSGSTTLGTKGRLLVSVTFATVLLGACGGEKSKETQKKSPGTVDALALDGRDTGSASQPQGPQGPTAGGQSAYVGQSGQGGQGGQGGHGGQGSVGGQLPQPAHAVDMWFPMRIVGQASEVIDLSEARFQDAQPRTTTAFHLRGVVVPAGTRVEGHLNLTKGTASAFSAHRLVLSDGRSFVVKGGGWVSSKEETVTSANVLAIIGGAAVGAGAGALVDSILGNDGVSGWSVAAGAVVGGILGWQLFPNRSDVVVVEKSAGSRLVLEAL